MKVLLTNDDGVHAEGLLALRDSLLALRDSRGMSLDVVVVAPDEQRSECGHSVTTREPLRVNQLDEGTYSVTGTPVDCVRIALSTLVPEVQLVVSGINHGGNLGADVWMSGTVAAAREASLRGLPAIAMSQYRHPDITLDWQAAGELAAIVAIDILRKHQQTTQTWNVNLPAVHFEKNPPRCFCDVDDLPMPIQYRLTESGYRLFGSYQDRPRHPDKDVAKCFAGNITISRL